MCIPCAAGFAGTSAVNNVVYEVKCVLLGSTYSTVALPTLASVCCVAPSTLCIAWLHLHWRVCVVWLHLHCVLRGSTYIGECVLCGSTYIVYCVAPPTLASASVQCAVATLILDEPFSGSTQKTQLRIVSELDTVTTSCLETPARLPSSSDFETTSTAN